MHVEHVFPMYVLRFYVMFLMSSCSHGLGKSFADQGQSSKVPETQSKVRLLGIMLRNHGFMVFYTCFYMFLFWMVGML